MIFVILFLFYVFYVFLCFFCVHQLCLCFIYILFAAFSMQSVCCLIHISCHVISFQLFIICYITDSFKKNQQENHLKHDLVSATISDVFSICFSVTVTKDPPYILFGTATTITMKQKNILNHH